MHMDCTLTISLQGGEVGLSGSERAGAGSQLICVGGSSDRGRCTLEQLQQARRLGSRCELLLEDAFAGVAPRDDFLAEEDDGEIRSIAVSRF